MIAGLCLLLGLQSAQAWDNTLLVDAGGSDDASAVVRLSYARNLGLRWWETGTGAFGLSLEAGAGYLFNEEGGNLLAFQALPMIAYNFRSRSRLQPFLEGGLGGAYLTEDDIDGVELGSNLHFANIFGAGVRFGPERRHSLGVRYLHYSNAGLNEDNHGINYYMLSYGLSF
jgi:lipid A 3-O-deacylase